MGLLAGVAAVVVVMLVVAVVLAARVAARWKSAYLRARDAEQDVRDTSDRLLQAVDGTTSVIYMRDLDGRYMLINRQYEQLFDVSRDAIVGMTDHDVFPKEVADAFRANDLRALAKGAPIQMEEIAPHADGPHTYVTVKYPITDRAGRQYAVCGISTDITDLKRAEEQVQRLNSDLERRVRERTAELEASTRELDAFVSSVSHDLRAPLRVIGEFSKILFEEYSERLDEKGRNYLHRVRSATERIGKLIDGLLEMSNAAARETIDRRRVDLGEMAHDVVAELESESRRHVEVDIEGDLVVAADSQLLKLTLRNLLSNAWQFTAKTAAPRVQIGATERAGARVFFVRDNGPGFARGEANGLYVPPERLTAVDDPRGIGIRLAIVARAIARHGGQAWVESEQHQGAAFFFTLAPAEESSDRRATTAG
jgi:PAS domain S-box-containing protein